MERSRTEEIWRDQELGGVQNDLPCLGKALLLLHQFEIGQDRGILGVLSSDDLPMRRDGTTYVCSLVVGIGIDENPMVEHLKMVPQPPFHEVAFVEKARKNHSHRKRYPCHVTWSF